MVDLEVVENKLRYIQDELGYIGAQLRQSLILQIALKIYAIDGVRIETAIDAAKKIYEEKLKED